MNITDSIADMLTRIRNASHSRHEQVEVPASKLKAEIARLLKEEGFIRNCSLVADGKQGILKIKLKYGEAGRPALTGIKRVSRPGRREFVGRARLPRVRNGLGLAIISTSRGLMTDKKARQLGVGGEVICYVW